MTTWINQQREIKGWSIREFGRRIGVSHTHAARLANGDIEPSADMCINIARVFDVSHNEVLIMSGYLDPEPPQTAKRREADHLFTQMSKDDQENWLIQMRAIVREKRAKYQTNAQPS